MLRKTHAFYQGTTSDAAKKLNESPEGTTELRPGCNPGLNSVKFSRPFGTFVAFFRSLSSRAVSDQKDGGL
jgi:hypothetical protein